MRPSPISKLFRFLALAAGAAALASCAAEPESASRAQGDGVFEEALTASFDRFEYRGSDAVFDRPLSADQYRNPILAGFYPDPSVVRVGDEYYMTHSTFGFYPGLPVFKSRDLVHWVQIGNAIDRPEMMDFTGMHLGWNGLYAPTLEYHRGSFYIINTCVGCGGNFVISASDPAGPWSDPVWISEIADVGGIDPQMFFENDRVFIVNHEMPEGPELYDGHRALWIREVDPQTYEILGTKKMIVDGGINHLVEKPGYVEGPHLYKVGDFYYLSAPEGGTGLDHRQTIYRAGDVWGPYEPYANNPILTQRTLDPARPDPITSTGHADMVETQNGEWWAVFLGTRNYDTIHFATGRETFLLPVTWTDDGWPVILEAGLEVPYIAQRPDLPGDPEPALPVTGNFAVVEEFDQELAHYWSFARTPKSIWWHSGGGKLAIRAREERIGDGKQPSIVARRLQHMNATAMARVSFEPRQRGDEAGIIAFQNDAYYYAFGLGLDENGSRSLRLRQRNGDDVFVGGRVLRERPLAPGEGESLSLRVAVKGPTVAFSYSVDGETYREFASGLDGKMLGSMTSGGFTGAFLGMYAETGEARPETGVSAADLPPGVIAPRRLLSKAYGSGQTHAVVESSLAEDGQVLRLVVQGRQPNPWDAGVSSGNLPGAVRAGDTVIVSFWARAVSGPGRVSPTLQLAAPPHDAALSETLELTREWKEHVVRLESALDIRPDGGSLVIHAGYELQTLEFGSFEIRAERGSGSG